MTSPENQRMQRTRSPQPELSRRRLPRRPPVLLRIERITECITKQIEPEHRGADCHSGEYRCPRCAAQLVEVAAVSDHRPPARRRWWNSKPQERERGFGHN